MSLTKKLERKRRLKEAKAIADQMTYDAYAEFCRKMDALWLYTLHEVFGFGKKRCERLYWAMVDKYIDITKMYNNNLDGDDMEWYVMQKKLLDIGVDVKWLQDEAERRYPKGAKAEVKSDG